MGGDLGGGNIEFLSLGKFTCASLLPFSEVYHVTHIIGYHWLPATLCRFLKTLKEH